MFYLHLIDDLWKKNIWNTYMYIFCGKVVQKVWKNTLLSLILSVFDLCARNPFSCHYLPSKYILPRLIACLSRKVSGYWRIWRGEIFSFFMSISIIMTSLDRKCCWGFLWEFWCEFFYVTVSQRSRCLLRIFFFFWENNAFTNDYTTPLNQTFYRVNSRSPIFVFKILYLKNFLDNFITNSSWVLSKFKIVRLEKITKHCKIII